MRLSTIYSAYILSNQLISGVQFTEKLFVYYLDRRLCLRFFRLYKVHISPRKPLAVRIVQLPQTIDTEFAYILEHLLCQHAVQWSQFAVAAGVGGNAFRAVFNGNDSINKRSLR